MMNDNGEGVPKDFTEAVRRCRLAAEQGDANAQFDLGLMYYSGEGVPKDATEAVRWFRLAADQGYAGAQYALGNMYSYGEGVPKDATEGVRWFRLAADQGTAVAQSDLGIMYADGRGVPKDATEAVRWYRLAAEQGDAEAQNNLGLMYLDGDGADQDTFEAVRLFESVAALGPNEVGFGYAATSLGWIYLTGKYPGISRNTEEALRWNLFGAGSGHTNALSNLAMMYAEGIGVERDYSIMLGYLIRSAEVFTDSFSWVLEKPDVWKDYVISAPHRFWEAREAYWRAIQTGGEDQLNELKSLR